MIKAQLSHKLRDYSYLFALSGMQVVRFFWGWFRYGFLRLGLPKDYLFIILLPFFLMLWLKTNATSSRMNPLSWWSLVLKTG